MCVLCVQAVEVLVNRGANVFAKNSRGKTAQSIAVSRGHEAIQHFLKTRMDALAAGTSTPLLMRAFSSPKRAGMGSSGHLLNGPSPMAAQSSVDMQAQPEGHQALADALTHPHGALLEGGDQRNSSGVSSGPTSPLLTFSFYSSKVSRAAAAKAMANVMGGKEAHHEEAKAF